jgi:hypothetical protein
LGADLAHLGQRIGDVEFAEVTTCAPNAREMAARSRLIPLGMTTSMR